MSSHEATFYVQIKGKRSRWQPRRVDQIDAVRVTQTKPTELLPGCIAIKLRVRIPDAAFEPFEPEAVIEIPPELIQHPVAVTADDANQS